MKSKMLVLQISWPMMMQKKISSTILMMKENLLRVNSKMFWMDVDDVLNMQNFGLGTHLTIGEHFVNLIPNFPLKICLKWRT